jgi:glycosyltransferase involved in cell wall biosynthesis
LRETLPSHEATQVCCVHPTPEFQFKEGMDMLKILMVISEVPPVTSGVARVAGHLRQGIEALGHHIDVISLGDVPRFVKGEVRVSSMLWRAPRLLLPHLDDYDIVHVHGPVPTFSDIALLLSTIRAGRNGPRVVYTHHCEIDLQQRGYRTLSALYSWAHKHMAKLADQVIVSTPAYASELGRYVEDQRVSVVPWGVDGDWYEHDVPKSERFTVLFVGQLRPYKGVDTLLKAAALLPNVDFQIVGSGFQEAHFRRAAEAGTLNNVVLRGKLTDDELHDAYRQSHVLVLPSTSRQEAFGLVLLEGMVAGCIPVASDLPGVVDTVGDAGFCFPVGDHEALASILHRLHDEPLARAAYCRRAKERARTYTWEHTIQAHRLIYDRLVMLQRFGKALRAEEGRASALRVLLQSVMDNLEASTGSIMVLEPKNMMLQLLAASGLPTDVPSRIGQPLGQGIAGIVASRRIPLLLPEAFESDPTGELAGHCRRSHIHSAISVPIHTETEVLGVMNLSSHVKHRRFKQDDLLWLSSLARQAADSLSKTKSA